MIDMPDTLQTRRQVLIVGSQGAALARWASGAENIPNGECLTAEERTTWIASAANSKSTSGRARSNVRRRRHLVTRSLGRFGRACN